jgi:hypothetical protein
MTTDAGFHHLLRNVAAFNHNLLVHHDGRRHRQIQFETGIGLLFGLGLGNKIDLNVIPGAQSGRRRKEMSSGLAVRLVQEKARRHVGLQ